MAFIPENRGAGLLCSYFNAVDLTDFSFSRIDPEIDFDWGASGSPDPRIEPGTFSARWVGRIQPLYAQTYTFYVTSSDGVRLYVDGTLVVNNWTDHSSTVNSGTIALEAQTMYAVQVDYYQNAGQGIIKLEWESASQAREVVPQSQLYYPASFKPGGYGA